VKDFTGAFLATVCDKKLIAASGKTKLTSTIKVQPARPFGKKKILIYPVNDFYTRVSILKREKKKLRR
jgi:hypothetical protein